ncbi:thiolase family protein [Truepera radiovictrix]|uniref:Acetyl-CoA acetyltransferase n=1 Tax=Truepera radiovictrix (strain DSM 17093 / CIP 108686 / LMG 22925 / RQ-24) TaxID=649638 RepID=D7CQW4_TRURR|nr:thiolase family protein [Truepera radiovictrix]ADI15098.1 acetyl-CoA acetyltransferase [Truepera radiovictrix DSM 17093]WMT56349.1 thiolase family protein [Truepera radiovictrix]
MNVVLASAVRTPFGAFQGALSPLKASQLGAVAIREAVSRAGLEAKDVDAVFMGNVLPAGMGQAPARQALRYAGLDDRTPAVTVSKVCGSGMEAIIQAARMVALGDAEIVVAGGMESMSNAPFLLPGARAGLRMGTQQLLDHMVHDGLWDAYYDKHMGSCAELCAAKYSFSREAQDAFAERSYRRAQEAAASGAFADEIVPVEVPGRKGTVIVGEDEEPARVKFDKIASLRPAFDPAGTVTAANASTINDGAAAAVVCREETARERGLPVLAVIEGYSGHATDPEWFTVAPVGAMRGLFKKLAASPSDFDLFEINEAFAVVVMAALQELGLSPERVNVHGGAVALGHPIGASGARIVGTLAHALRRRGGGRGVASICIGGGEALALALRVPA